MRLALLLIRFIFNEPVITTFSDKNERKFKFKKFVNNVKDEKMRVLNSEAEKREGRNLWGKGEKGEATE